MALASTDLFVVQKDPGGGLAKVTAQELNDYLEASDSVTYKGAKDFGASLDDPATSGTLNVGDLYINNGNTDGAFAWTNGPTPTPNPVAESDRCVWNGVTWDYFSDGIQDAGVEVITGGVGITVAGTPANPVVDADYATTLAIGAVQIATDADVANGNVGNPAELVVTAAQLKSTNDAISSAGGGTVTNVTGTSPITVTNNTSTPVVAITVATETEQGTVRLATDAEATAGIVTDAVITVAQLKANVPTDVGVETVVEGGTGTVSGAMVIEGSGTADVSIGVQEDVFCPYNFKLLPDA